MRIVSVALALAVSLLVAGSLRPLTRKKVRRPRASIVGRRPCPS